MGTSQNFYQLLNSLDKQKYGMYKRIKGIYNFGKFGLAVDHVQVDPYAPPSKMRVIMDRDTSDIPDNLLDSKSKSIAIADFLTRVFARCLQSVNKKSKESKVFIDRHGQEILERTAVVVNESEIEVRIEVGLPATGRKILGKQEVFIFKEMLPEAVETSLLFENIDQDALYEQVTLMLDQDHILKVMKERDLIAFVANDAILPRESGVSDKPLQDGVPFHSPETLKT